MFLLNTIVQVRNSAKQKMMNSDMDQSSRTMNCVMGDLYKGIVQYFLLINEEH